MVNANNDMIKINLLSKKINIKMKINEEKRQILIN